MPILVQKIQPYSKKFFAYFLAALLTLVLFEAVVLPGQTDAAQLTSRKVTLSTSSPAASAATTTYTFDFTTGTTATIASIKAQACTTASGACTIPTGWDEASSTLSSTTFSGTWSVSTATNGELRASATGASSTSSGVAKQIVWGNVQNPTTANETFFMRITTYTGSDWSTGSTDTGVVAASTATQISVSASVDESLTFCTGTSGITTSSCSGATGSSVSLGTLTASSTGSGISQIGVGTNGASGYAVTMNGSTLTCSACAGSPTISALASQTASSTGGEQFGVNLRDNATPNVGVEPDGAGNAAPTASYNTVDQYRFVTGDSIASDSSTDDFRRFHVAYIANIGTGTEAGAYSTTLTFIATATF